MSPSNAEQAAIAAFGQIEPARRLRFLSHLWMEEATRSKTYAYQFTWMGRPIIQVPQDLVAMQQIIWKVRPTRIVETGIAHGGSLIFYASLLELIGKDGRVVGVDVDIRAHNRSAIEQHSLYRRIDLVEGSSIDPAIAKRVAALATTDGPVLVCLDSNHTHAHVLEELRLYSPLVTKDSYLVVFDTAIALLPDELFGDRPWGTNDNPLTAVRQFLKENDRFVSDDSIPDSIAITVAPGGYLRCVKD